MRSVLPLEALRFFPSFYSLAMFCDCSVLQRGSVLLDTLWITESQRPENDLSEMHDVAGTVRSSFTSFVTSGNSVLKYPPSSPLRKFTKSKKATKQSPRCFVISIHTSQCSVS